MGEQEYVFRGAAFGGFNREDVLRYIRKMAEEHRQETAELRKQLSDVTDQRDRFQSQVKQAETAGDKLSELEGQAGALTEENDRLKAENERLRGERDQLQEQIRTWTPSITTYGAIKDQMAEIELNARERGAMLLRRAERQAGDLRRQAGEVVQHTAAWYDRTRNDTNQTLDYVSQELERIRGELQALSAVMDCDGRSLFGLGMEEESHE